MNKRNAAIVGALTITIVLYLQDIAQGEQTNIVRIATSLFLGALLGLGVAKFVNWKKSDKTPKP